MAAPLTIEAAEDGAEVDGKAATGEAANEADEDSDPEVLSTTELRLWCGGLIRMYLPGEPCCKEIDMH